MNSKIISMINNDTPGEICKCVRLDSNITWKTLEIPLEYRSEWNIVCRDVRYNEEESVILLEKRNCSKKTSCIL